MFNNGNQVPAYRNEKKEAPMPTTEEKELVEFVMEKIYTSKDGSLLGTVETITNLKRVVSVRIEEEIARQKKHIEEQVEYLAQLEGTLKSIS